MATEIANQRQSLNLDLESLFPGETLTIGDTSIVIRPLGFYQLDTLLKQVKGIGILLKEKGVNWQNFNAPNNMFIIATVILANAPGVLEEASNINREDLKKAPIELIVQIVETVISVNMASKESLEKNFKSLAAKFTQKKEETPAAEQKPKTVPTKKIQKTRKK